MHFESHYQDAPTKGDQAWPSGGSQPIITLPKAVSTPKVIPPFRAACPWVPKITKN